MESIGVVDAGGTPGRHFLTFAISPLPLTEALQAAVGPALVCTMAACRIPVRGRGEMAKKGHPK